MSRFTKKELKDKFGFYPIHTGNSGWVANEATDKLGKLEDLLEKYGISDSVNFDYLEKCIQDHDKYGELQEQLGCPLEIREKAFNDGFYDAEGNHYFCEHYVPYLKSMHTRGISIGREKHFNLEDYKKTWWLKEDRSE